MKITILTVGKTKESWLKEAIEEYTKRLSPYVTLEWIIVKNDDQLLQQAEKQSGTPITLTPEAKQQDSVQFSETLLKELEKQGSRLTFIIGGAEGVPPSIKEQSLPLSFSKMTLTHQITRLVLVEQIYRAFEIAKGSGYHK